MEAVTDNTAKNRYEMDVSGQTVYANYRRDGEVAHILYVEAPPALRGTGAAGRLMEGIVALARRDGFKLYPVCGYAVSWLRRHEDTADIVAH